MTYYNGEMTWEEDYSRAWTTVDRVELYGQREIKVELEDYSLSAKEMVQGGTDVMALRSGDYDIASVEVCEPTFYDWEQYAKDENGELIMDKFVSWTYYKNEEAAKEIPLTLYGRSLMENGEPGEWTVYAVIQNGEITLSNGASYRKLPTTRRNYATGATETIGYNYQVILPAGVHFVKTGVVSKNSRVSMDYTVNVRLYPDGENVERLLDKALSTDTEETYAMLSLVNDARGYATIDTSEDASYYGTAEIAELSGNLGNKTDDDFAVAYIHGRNFRVAASLDKSYEIYTGEDDYSTPFFMDAENERIEFTNTVVLTQQSNLPQDMKDEYKLLIENGTLPNTQGGTYYELLPEGVTLDESSVLVDGGAGELESIYTVKNYMLSGRDLVVIKVKFTSGNTRFIYELRIDTTWSKDRISAENYEADTTHYPKTGWLSRHTLTYVSYLSYEEAFSRSVEGTIPPLVNAAMYEADEETVGTILNWYGEPDDPSAGNNIRTNEEIVNPNGRFDLTSLVTDLDKDRDDPSFLYSTAYLDLNEALFGVVIQGRKHVSLDGLNWETGRYSDARVTVYEGATYSYRISKIVNEGDSQKGVIFYDGGHTPVFHKSYKDLERSRR